MPYKVLIVGASGLIGGNLLSELIEYKDFSEITALVRKPLGLNNPKLKELTINFDELGSYVAEIKADIIFCCIGTTKKKTPDNKTYRKIDLEYPLMLAKIGLKNGIKQFHIVSSIGADSKSKNSYLKLKGELEDSLKSLKIKSLHIYQPSFLEGKRLEMRVLEKTMLPIIKFINPFLMGSFKNYRSIKALDVAKAMINQSKKELNGVFTYHSDQIKKLA